MDTNATFDLDVTSAADPYVKSHPSNKSKIRLKSMSTPRDYIHSLSKALSILNWRLGCPLV